MLTGGLWAAQQIPQAVAGGGTFTWNSGGTDDNWSSGSNWDAGAPSDLQNVLQFGSGTRTNPINDLSSNAGWQILFTNGSPSFALSGNAITFYDWGGIRGKIENNSSNPQAVNLNIAVGNSIGGGFEIDPTLGDLTIGGIVSLGAYPLNVYGNSGKTLSFTSTVFGDGAFTILQNSIVRLQGAGDNVSLGATVLAGTLILEKNPSSSGVHAIGGDTTVAGGGTLRLGGSGGDQIYDLKTVAVNSGGVFDLNGRSETISALSMAGALTNGDSAAATLTINNQSTITGATGIGGDNGDLAIAGNGPLTALSTQTVTKVGSNTVTLSCGPGLDNVNILVDVSGGKLLLAKPDSSSSQHTAARVTVNSGATLRLAGSGGWQIYQGLDSTVNSGGVLDLNGQSQPFDSTHSLIINGTGIDNGGALVNNAATASTLSNSANNSTAVLTLGSDSSIGGSGTLTISGLITGDGKTLTKVGTGLLVLNNASANSFSNVVLNSGTLSIWEDDSLGTLPGSPVTNLTFSGNSTLRFGHQPTSAVPAQRLIAINDGVVAQMDPQTHTGRLAGVISGGGSIRKIGPGALLLSGANSFTGGVEMADGTLGIWDDDGLGALPGSPTTRLVFSGDSTLYFQQTPTLPINANRLITINAGVTATIATTNTASFDSIFSGAGALTKAGSGIVTLNSANTYSGDTTIQDGTLALAGAGTVGANTPNIVISGGATLDVAARSDSLVLVSQTLKGPGTAAIGSIKVSGTAGLTLANSGTALSLPYFASGTAALDVTGASDGALTLQSGGTVHVAIKNGGVPLGAGSYKLVSKSGTATGVTFATAAPPVVVNEVGSDGIAAGGTASLRVSSGELYLDVCTTPAAYNMTGGGTYCSGDSGVPVGLSGSDTGVNYQLKLNGNNIGSPVPGTSGSLSFGDQTGVGTYTVVAVSSIGDCTANMSGSVSVAVNSSPTIDCPSNINVAAAPGQCVSNVSFSASTTGIPTPTLTCTPPSGSAFAVGTTTVDCTASNDCDTTSCNFTVAVNDAEEPTINCPASIQTNAAGPVAVNWSATASDNCSGVSSACTPPSGSTFSPGVTTVSCTATDAAGNTASCSFTVSICSLPQPVIYVDGSYVGLPGGTLVDWPHTGSGTHVIGCDAFAAIQDGIAAVADNGTVNVAAGVYVETGQIVISKNLVLVGANKATTIIKPAQDTGTSGDSRAWFLVADGKDFSLENVTLDGTGHKVWQAIRHKGSGVIADCILTNLQYEAGGPSYAGTAIAVYSAGNVDISNCVFAAIGREGVAPYDAATGTYRGNSFQGKGVGDWLDYAFVIQYGANITVTNNLIADCVGVASVDNSASGGIAVWDDPGTVATIRDNLFTNNTVGLAIAVLSGGAMDPQVEIGSGNTFIGGEIGVDFENVGEVAAANPAVTFGANIFKWQSNYAIGFYTNISAGDTFDIGSVVFEDALDNVITNNFSKEDSVYHVVDATDRGLLVWNPGNVYVTTNSGSIQRGIDAAAAGWTVSVDAGTYVENVTVAKALTLLGPNAGTAGASLSRVAEAHVIPAIDDPENTPLISVEANGITIDGFLLDGDNPALNAGYDAGGVDVNAAAAIQNGVYPALVDIDHLTVQNNILRNTSYDDVYVELTFGLTNGWNYIQRNQFETAWEGLQTYAVHAVIADNVFTNVNRGMSLHGTITQAPTGFTPVISNNVVTIGELWPPSWVGRLRSIGIWVNYRRGNAAPLEVIGNVVNTPVAAPTGKTLRGLFALTVDGAGKIDFIDNTVNGEGNCMQGLYAFACPSNNAVTVHGGALNNINDVGILVQTTDPDWGTANSLLSASNVTVTVGASGAGAAAIATNTPARVARLTVAGNCQISGGTDGVLVLGTTAAASVLNNASSIVTNGVGVYVDGGAALIENNNLTGNTVAGIVATNGAVVDAGDCAGANVTGLGTGSGLNGSSAGLNNLSGYGFDNAAPWAVENLNGGTPVVLAQLNNYGAGVGDNIGAAVSGAVTYSQFGGVLVSCPPAVSVQCVADVPAGATTLAQFLTLGGQVSCSSATVSYSDGALTPGPVDGTITRTYTIIDDCGQTNTCVQTITVQDTTAPSLSLAAPAGASADSGCQALVPSVTYTVSDNCDASPVVVQSPTAGTSVGLGSQTITVIATDAGGNATTQTTSFVVSDTTAPAIIACITNRMISVDGSCQVALPDLTAEVTASDNCGGSLNTTQNPPAGTFVGLGPTTVTVAVDDGRGNTNSCTAIVTAIDSTPPLITCPLAVIVNINSGQCVATGVVLEAPATNDNCSVATVVNNAPLSYPVGTNHVVWTATDVGGNSASCTQMVIVVDNEAPSITCPGDMAVNTDPGECTASNVTFSVTTNDNCPGNTYVCVPASGATFAQGTNTVTCTATDTAGNSAACSFRVTVYDIEVPSIVCAPVSVQCASEVPTANTNASIVVSDNCGTVTVSWLGDVISDQTCPNRYTIARSYLATDEAGNTNGCTQTIEVDDTTPPTALCTNITVDLNASGVAMITADQVDGGSFDNCGGSLARSIDNAAFGCGSIGSNTVVLTVIDACGNSNSCEAIVVVRDVRPPVLNCPANVTVNADAGECDATNVVLGTPTHADNCGLDILANNALASYPVGTNYVVWTATDVQGNSASCTQQVVVVDNQPPTITCPADIVTGTTAGMCEALNVTWAVMVAENCPGASSVCVPPSGSAFMKGTTSVTCTATDASGNTAACSFNVTVNDPEPPAIVCAPVNVQCAGEVPPVGTNAVAISDNCGPVTLTWLGDTTNALGCVNHFVITRQYRVTDSSGNTNGCTQTITVHDTTPPTAVCTNLTLDLNVNGLAFLTAAQMGGGSYDNCFGPVSLAIDRTIFGCGDLGPNNVQLTVSDQCGNSSTCLAVVTVRDVTAPVITSCPATVTVNANTGQCGATGVALGTATATDNCGWYVYNNAPSFYPIGTNYVVWTVTDEGANSTSCTQTVIVVDNLPPSVNCPVDIVTSTDTGQCTKSNVFYAAIATDNCANLTVTYDPPSGSTFPIGTTAVFVNVVDASGNSAAIKTYGNINTDAGTGVAGYSGDGGAAASARMNGPYHLATDHSGNLYVADLNNNRIRRVDATTGIITTVAGNGITGFSGDGGVATNASLNNPTAVAVDRLGNLFISDYGNSRVRRVDAATGVMTTVAGNGIAGFSGDGGAATNASLKFIYGITVDDFGNLFIADSSNNRIRRVDADTGIITTVAGNGVAGYNGDGIPATSAKLYGPFDVTADSAGNLFIADVYNARIRRVDAATGIITTVAGTGSSGYNGDGIPATSAKLYGPFDVTVDSAGNLFIADWFNYRVRWVDVASGLITTLAGTGSLGYNGDGIPAFTAGLTDPTGTAIDRAGNLYIAELNGQRVRRVDSVAACSFTVTVNDAQPPSVICPTNLAVGCAVAVPLPDTNAVSVADNCGMVSVSFVGDVIGAQSCPSRYTITRTYQATDSSGNTATCTQLITVNDETPPAFTSCPSNLVTSADFGQCSKSNVTWMATASDACDSSPAVICVPPSGSTFRVGETSVHCLVSDNCDNTSSCDFSVTVNDAQSPVISACVGSQTLPADANCQAVLPDLTGQVVATDNCGGTPMVAQSPAAGTVLGLGTNLVVWTAIDSHGNSAACTQAVIVTVAAIDSADCRIVTIRTVGDDISLTWQTYGNTTNIVQCATPIIDGNFTNNFVDLATVAVPGSGILITNWVDYGGATNSPSRFYRIHVLPGSACQP
jgi:autotransporter-associated beta strand protein